VKRWWAPTLCALLFAAASHGDAQESALRVPGTVKAGSEFSIGIPGSGGSGSLYVIGMGQVIKREVQLGGSADFASGTLASAGHYLVVLETPNSQEKGSLDVAPADQAANLSFLARPSRLPVKLQNAITGAVYVFDAYHNLITAPKPVSFELSNPSGQRQERTVNTRDGAAWVALDSGPHRGADKFVAQTGGVSTSRIVEQVPGDPCGLKMNAKQVGREVELETDPVRDCSGNAVTDGTIVTFTESYGNSQSTVDVPIKRGIAKVDLPDHPGATISIASGVVLGNQIHWEK